MFDVLNQYLDTWIHFWFCFFQECWVPDIFQGQVLAILLRGSLLNWGKTWSSVMQNIYIDEDMQS